MGKVNCKCGTQISDVGYPCSQKGWLMSDISQDFEGQKDACEIMQMSIDVWECLNCGAIAFGNRKDNGLRWYYPIEKPALALMEMASDVRT
jgi:hypothetical protein